MFTWKLEQTYLCNLPEKHSKDPIHSPGAVRLQELSPGLTETIIKILYQLYRLFGARNFPNPGQKGSRASLGLSSGLYNKSELGKLVICMPDASATSDHDYDKQDFHHYFMFSLPCLKLQFHLWGKKYKTEWRTWLYWTWHCKHESPSKESIQIIINCAFMTTVKTSIKL